MDERMRFVIRLKDGETMASLCREFGISRKTGYKIFERYEQCGLEGLSDRARRPFRYANQLPEPVEAAIVAAKKEKPHWGARKIRERLLRRLPHAVKIPACSTIHAVMDRLQRSGPEIVDPNKELFDRAEDDRRFRTPAIGIGVMKFLLSEEGAAFPQQSDNVGVGVEHIFASQCRQSGFLGETAPLVHRRQDRQFVLRA